jgi:hypothetical protein
VKRPTMIALATSNRGVDAKPINASSERTAWVTV